MPESKLQHELFETGSRPVLDYPPFGPETVRQDMIGQATLFVPTENDPVRYYGSPKPTLLEVRFIFPFQDPNTLSCSSSTEYSPGLVQ